MDCFNHDLTYSTFSINTRKHVTMLCKNTDNFETAQGVKFELIASLEITVQNFC